MPPKFRYTREEMIAAALELVRQGGKDALTARALGAKLGCSAKPIFGLFRNMEELEGEVIAAADAYYQKYLVQKMQEGQYPPYKASGMAYIRFAREERHLFRFLFQSDYFNGKTLLELIDAEELIPVLSAMQRSLGIGMEQTKTVFITVFLFAHGYASMIANNSLKYDEDTINSHLERAYRGAILAAQEEAT